LKTEKAIAEYEPLFAFDPKSPARFLGLENSPVSLRIP